ncbi:MAG TPA: hypothetical protein PLK12_13820, partial [Prolixibacteraceae bacterium]|nr:hypothetical protein [Prolixibacteraceae bacterium]
LITELTGQIDLVSGWIRNGVNTEEAAGKLNRIRNEIQKLDREQALPPFALVSKLLPETFTLALADSAKAHLEQLKKYHNGIYQETRKNRDRMTDRISRENEPDYLYNLKMKHHNKALEVLVLNSDLKDYFRETPNGIMQKIAPAYKAPDYRNGRAHFLASQKNIQGWVVPTLWFNLMVIWLMNLVLYLALYFDWIRKLIHLKTGISFKRKK